MFRYVLLVVMAMFLGWALRRTFNGFVEGLYGRGPRAGAPVRGVQMARDPVCGTYVVPDRAVALTVGPQRIFFCSTDCRDKYRAGTA